MRFAILFISLFLMSEECNQPKNSAQQDLKNMKVNYQAITRGFFKQITFEEAFMTYSEDPNLQSIDTFKLVDADWKAILRLLNKLDLDNLETLVAPTDKRLYDGAAHANIIVNDAKKEFTSASFDEGYPPKQIEELVNKMLSISKNYVRH